MASLGDMPNVARNIMSFCSGHGLYNNGFLGLKKRIIGRIQGFDSALFISLSRTCRGPTPNEPTTESNTTASLDRIERINKMVGLCISEHSNPDNPV